MQAQLEGAEGTEGGGGLAGLAPARGLVAAACENGHGSQVFASLGAVAYTTATLLARVLRALGQRQGGSGGGGGGGIGMELGPLLSACRTPGDTADSPAAAHTRSRMWQATLAAASAALADAKPALRAARRSPDGEAGAAVAAGAEAVDAGHIVGSGRTFADFYTERFLSAFAPELEGLSGLDGGAALLASCIRLGSTTFSEAEAAALQFEARERGGLTKGRAITLHQS